MGRTVSTAFRPGRRRDPQVVLVCCAYCRRPAARFQVSWAGAFDPRVRPGNDRRVQRVWEEATRPPRRLNYRLWCGRSKCQSTYVLQREELEPALVRAAIVGDRRVILPKDARIGSNVPRVFNPAAL